MSKLHIRILAVCLAFCLVGCLTVGCIPTDPMPTEPNAPTDPPVDPTDPPVDPTDPPHTHTPDEDDGDCTTDILCTECGEVVVPGAENHTPAADDGDCTTDITCTVCGKVTTEGAEAHTPAEDDGDCTTDIACAVCGKVTTEGAESHSFGTNEPACIVCGTANPGYVPLKINGFSVVGEWADSHINWANYGPKDSFDGNLTSFWNPMAKNSYAGEPGIVYELNGAYDLNKFVFTLAGVNYFKLYVSSNGTDYKLVADIDADNCEKAYIEKVCTLEGLNLKDVRYVKLIFTGHATGNVWVGLYEAQMTEDGRKDLDVSWMLAETEDAIIYSKVNVVDWQITGTFTSDLKGDTFVGPMKSYDGDPSTKWNPLAQVNYAGAPGIIYELEDIYDLEQLKLTFAAGEVMYMDIFGSSDGVSYTTIASITEKDISMYNNGVATIDASAAKGVQFIKVIFNGKASGGRYINFMEFAVTAKIVNEVTLKVSGAFSSNMVLQREKPISVWGWAKEGELITGTFAGKTVTTTAGEDGKWTIAFPQQAANAKGQTMTITGMGKTVTFDDILIGDVYLISGQSNAELRVLNTAAHLDSAGLQAVYDQFREDMNIRIFHQTRSYVVQNSKYWNTPQQDVINRKWSWKKAAVDDDFADFSALGMYFAKTLRENLDEDIPIGLIQMAAGAAFLSELMPTELCDQFGYAGKITVSAGGYYNTMIHPFVGLPISGMLFYQGESYDSQHVAKYAEELTAFVTELRNRWGQDFNFYNVQLSTHGQIQIDNNVWPELPIIRDQQFKVLSMLDNYYLTTSMDVGYRGEVDTGTNIADYMHPKDKKTLGERIALQALAVYYGEMAVGEESFSPVPGDVQWSKDGILISFQNAETLKLATGDTLLGFQCVINAEAVDVTGQIVNGNQVLLPVDATTVSQVRYGIFQLAYPENANLVNGSGLPTPAFILDNPG